MKKLFMYLLIILILLLTLTHVKADDTLINYACDYNIGDLIFFRIKVYNLPQKYVKDSEAIDSMSGINNYVEVFYLAEDGTYKKDKTSTGINQYKNYSTVKKKLDIFYGVDNYSIEQNKKRFLIRSTKDANNIICPELRYYENNSHNKMYVSSYDSFTLYDENGNSYETKGNAIGAGNLVCYDSDNVAHSCDKVDVGQLIADGDKECTYTANRDSRFKITYNANNKSLKFESLTTDGLGRLSPQATASTSFSLIGDHVYSVDSPKMLEQFKSGKCPSKITCDCSQFSGCYFYDKVHEDCGKLVGEDGVDNDGKFDRSINNDDNQSGDAPSAPSLDFGEARTCEEIVGKNGAKLFKFLLRTIRIVAAITAIVVGMMKFIPAITAKDPAALKKAAKNVVMMLIILVLIFLLPSLIRIIAHLFDFDASCFL